MQTTRILGSLLGFDKIENHVEINKKIVPVIKDKIVATNIAEQTDFSFTSDKTDISKINDNLHTHEDFSDLFFEIEKSLNIFLVNLNMTELIILLQSHGRRIQKKISLYKHMSTLLVILVLCITHK